MKNTGTVERLQPGMTSAITRRNSGTVDRLGCSCRGARLAPAPAHVAKRWLKVPQMPENIGGKSIEQSYTRVSVDRRDV